MVPATRTWIDTNLTRPQRRALVDWLAERSASPTGLLILDALRELFPAFAEDDLPSVQACLTWRNKVWAAEMSTRRLREQGDVARMLADAGDGKNLDEANRVLLQSLMLEQLQLMHDGDTDALDPKMVQALGRNVTALARQRQAEEKLAAELAKAKREQADWEAKQAAAAAALNNPDLTDAEKQQRMRALFGIVG